MYARLQISVLQTTAKKRQFLEMCCPPQQPLATVAIQLFKSKFKRNEMKSSVCGQH